MKTIKQLADEIGVSKTSINKKIDNLGLRSKLSKIDNRWLVPESLEKSIKDAYIDNQKSTTKTDNQPQTVFDLVSTLQKQIEVKDEQLKAKDEQIQSLLITVNQAQQLQALAEQKLKLLEEKKETAPGEPEPSMTKKWWQIFK